MDHHLTTPRPAKLACLPAPQQNSPDMVSLLHKLASGQAVTLRAKQLSVLRIAHGRVWATLSHAGTYSRVRGGDHFLSPGQSLTLLPGQALVMESFDSFESFDSLPNGSHLSMTQFSWETPGVASRALQAAKATYVSTGSGVLQPLRDLRHALKLAVGACSRLVQALARSAASILLVLPNICATFLIARSARTSCQDSYFKLQKSR